MGSLLMRRREMMQSLGGTTSVVVKDETMAASGTYFKTGAFTNTEVAAYNSRQPDRAIFRLYPKSDSVASGNGRFCIWNNSGFMGIRLCSASNNGTINFAFGDGTECAIETVMTKTAEKTYSIRTETNTDKVFTATGVSWGMANSQCVMLDKITPAIGTRIVVIFEYDN